jgi:hypothetical protein
MHPAQRPNKKVVLPFGNVVTIVERHTTGRYDRIPIINGLFKPFFLLNSIANFFATVFDPVGNGRPAIILAGFNMIEFITPSWTEFSFPQVARCWIKSKALNVTMPIGIQLGSSSRLACKWIAGSRFAFFGNSDDFSQTRIERLSLWACYFIRTLSCG